MSLSTWKAGLTNNTKETEPELLDCEIVTIVDKSGSDMGSNGTGGSERHTMQKASDFEPITYFGLGQAYLDYYSHLILSI